MYPTNELKLDSCQMQSGVHQANMRQAQSTVLQHSNVRGYNGKGNIDLQGSLGEVAYAVYFERPFSYSIGKWKQPDFYTRNDKPVDVKTSKGDTLYVSPRHLHSDWFYMLIQQLGENHFKVIGYIKGDKVRNFPLVDKWNRGSKVFEIPASALTPVAKKYYGNN